MWTHCRRRPPKFVNIKTEGKKRGQEENKKDYKNGFVHINTEERTDKENQLDHLHESYSDGKRTVKDCQKRWQSVQSDAKGRIAKYKQAVKGTGGGPTSPPLDELDELVADILGMDNVTFEGCDTNEELLSFVHETVECQPKIETREFPHPAAAPTPALATAAPAAAAAAAAPPAAAPAEILDLSHLENNTSSCSKFMVVGEGELIHIEKKRKLEIQLLEEDLMIKKEERILKMKEIELQEAQIEAARAQTIYYTNMLQHKIQ
ncbi:hypothetical protein Pcinc_005159 [Petrolisthes cinctipes]|uniref:Myb/SANT-like DNA-binding domain-containing protein n=1 Tax=Petrolisthes cinctipes TaxID=88211 RepID=A0AAE1GFS4_PETCI|nr:hypothetical protein Pcinc_005159 [Petrolisthes cinctipes]